jgi:endonuclease/exonuclease/phosphatase family metal-dependent hydrolase
MKRSEHRAATLTTALIWFALIGAALGACDFSEAGDTEPEKITGLTLMTWNLQALFDGTETGNEYEEYREAAGWSAEKYAGRLSVIAGAIGGMETPPDIVAVQEAESAGVLQDLAGALAKQGYGWTHFAANPGMSLGLGVLSRFPLENTKAHSVTVNGDTAPRPVLETWVNAGGSGLVLFVCHWKSKLGSEDATEATRRASARIILRRLRELAAEEPELPVIVMGDLNENYDEFYRRNGEVISALLPDDPRSASQTGFYQLVPGTAKDAAGTTEQARELQKDFLILSKNKPPAARYFPAEAWVLYSPWAGELKNGSYYYKNDWETIDHFLLSAPLFDNSGWEYEGCAAADYPPFASPNGYPAAYNPRTGSGLSDHLPLLLSLRLVKK